MSIVEKTVHWSVSAISPGQEGNGSYGGFDGDNCLKTTADTFFTCSNELCRFETEERRLAKLHEQIELVGHRMLARIKVINNSINELNEYYAAREEYDAMVSTEQSAEKK